MILYFAHSLSIEAHHQVVLLLELLERHPISGLLTMSPGYTSLLLRFDPLLLDHVTVKRHVHKLLDTAPEFADVTGRVLEIPVCYEPSFAPDLEEVAVLHDMTPAEVIQTHMSQTYLVYFLGFVPGFAYMGELPASIVTPRRRVPRRSVPAGSVGIVGCQTGVYPTATQGGWNLIGRCPFRIFDAFREPASLFAVGDRVRFTRISADEFTRMQDQKR